MSNPIDVFKYVNENEDEYLDFEEEYQPIKSFFQRRTKKTYGIKHNTIYQYIMKVKIIY